MNKKTDLITEAILTADKIKKIGENRASKMFMQEFSPAIKSMLADVINEGVSTGSDQPGGYGQNADKDAIAGGKDINDGTGDGPDNLQEGDMDVPDENAEGSELGGGEEEMPVMEGQEEFSLDGGEEDNSENEMPVTEGFGEDEDFPGSENTGDEDVEKLGEADFNDGTELGGEEDNKDEVIEIVQEGEDFNFGEKPEEEKPLTESAKKLRAYKRAYSKVIAENKKLRKAVGTLREGFDKLNLFNAKLAYAFKLMRQPGLTRSEKKYIAEAFDGVKSVREAKMIHNTILRTLGKKSLTEQKNPLLHKNITSTKSKLNEEGTRTSDRMSVLAFGEDYLNG